MVNPIVPYAIRGAIWYQGESVVGGPQGVMLYGHVMDTLVTQWRRLWRQGDFPFYVVQLPGQANVSNNPLIREQQAKILSLPNTGMAVVLDTGEIHNVHPKNKEPLGEDLSKIALANVYGRKIEFSGPVYASSKVEGNAIRIKFTHAAGLKSKDGGPLKWFQIAGADQKFVDADAKIVGDSVVVSSPQVGAPLAVRYAWDNFPTPRTSTTAQACRPHPSAPTTGTPCLPSPPSSPENSQRRIFSLLLAADVTLRGTLRWTIFLCPLFSAGRYVSHRFFVQQVLTSTSNPLLDLALTAGNAWINRQYFYL